MAELFASRLSTLLAQKGLSQKELAIRTGLTPAAISRYVSGDRVPREIIVAKIAKALDVQPNDLTGTSAEQAVDGAVQLIARNAHSLSDDQREQLIKAILKR